MSIDTEGAAPSAASESVTQPTPREGFVAGLLASSSAAFILIAGSAMTGTTGFLELVHNGATRYVPLPLFEAAVSTLGPLAKSLLFLGIVAVLVLAGGVIGALAVRFGLIERRSTWTDGLFMGGLAWLIAELVVLPLFGAGFLGSSAVVNPGPLHVPLGVASLGYGLVLVGLVRSVGRAPASAVPTLPPAPEQTPGLQPAEAARSQPADAARSEPAEAGGMPRRTFLGRSLVVVGLAALAGTAVGVASRLAHALSVGVTGSARPQAPGGFGPTPKITPVNDFYVIGKDLVPTTIDVGSWHLTVSGMVDRPQAYSLDDIRALPAVEDYRTLQCISNEIVRFGALISTQRWRGVPARVVLEAAGVQAAATHVLWRSADGYTESIPLGVAMDERTWLAYEMGPPGTALTPDHGFPLRVLIAGRYGMKQPKYLVEMIVADHDEPGYWEQRSWDQTAAVRTYSRIDEPLDGDDVPAEGSFGVYGVASAGDRGIARVEVSSDGGATWHQAELEPPLSQLSWVRWRTQVEAGGTRRLELLARATDQQGNVQDATPRPTLPSGATGLHRISVTAVPTSASPTGG